MRSTYSYQTYSRPKERHFSQTATAQVDPAKIWFLTSSDGLIVLQLIDDGLIQIVVPPSLHQRIIMVSHHPPDSGCLRQRRKYDTLCFTFYWLHMTTVFDHIVNTCPRFARYNPKYRNRRKLQLFQASGPRDFFAMDIVVPFLKTTQGSQYIFFTTNQFFKLTGAIPTSKAIATRIAKYLL